jgi:hypothetical protein
VAGLGRVESIPAAASRPARDEEGETVGEGEALAVGGGEALAAHVVQAVSGRDWRRRASVTAAEGDAQSPSTAEWGTHTAVLPPPPPVAQDEEMRQGAAASTRPVSVVAGGVATQGAGVGKATEFRADSAEFAG